MKITRVVPALTLIVFGLTVTLPALATPGSCESKLASGLSTRMSEERLREMVDYLTGERSIASGLRLRERSSDASREATRWSLIRHFETLGFRPEFEPFPGGANVIVEITGTEEPNEILEIGAHFDSIETGADDNAAGVAVLVHLAELLKKTPPKKTLRMVFHDLEEKNGEGARHHASQLVHDPRHLIGVLLIDAIGFYPSDLKPQVLTIETGLREDNRSLAQSIQKAGAGQSLELSFEKDSVPFSMADHSAYWSNGRPAILLSRPYGDRYNSPYNHTRRDTPANMNWPYYLKAARTIAAIVDNAVNSHDIASVTEPWSQPASILDKIKKADTPTSQAAATQSHDPFNGHSYYYWDQPATADHGDAPIDRHEGYMEELRSAMKAAEVPPKTEKKKPYPVHIVLAKSKDEVPPNSVFPSQELEHDYRRADPFIRDVLDAHERAFPGAIRYGHINFYTPLNRLARVQKALLAELAGNPALAEKWDEREPMTDFTITVTSTSQPRESKSLDQRAWDRLRQRWADKVAQHVSSWGGNEYILDRLKRLSSEVFRDRNRYLFAASDTDFMRALSLYLLSANLMKKDSTRESLEYALEGLDIGSLDYLKDKKAYGPLIENLEIEDAEGWVKKTHDWIFNEIYTHTEAISLREGQKLIVREVPPDIAIFRGYVGNDCATSFSPGFPFTPADRYYYVFDHDNRSLGYVGISLVEIENKKAVFVHTIQGPDLTSEHTEMLLRAFAEIAKPVFEAELAVLGPDRSIDNNVNFYPISRTMMAAVAGKPARPVNFWDQNFRNIIVKYESTPEYDDPQKNNLGRLIEYSDTELVRVDISRRPFENKFKSP